jgi:hypothetical protein
MMIDKQYITMVIILLVTKILVQHKKDFFYE